jgi:hypothetical protein
VRLRLLLAIALVTPVAAHAAGTIEALDTIAGVSTEIRLTGFSPRANLTLTIASPNGGTLEEKMTADATGNATKVLRGGQTERAGSYVARADDGHGSAHATFTVFPDRMDAAHSTITVDRTAITPDGEDSATVTVTLQDTFGNPLPHRIASLLPSRTDDTVDMIDRETDAAGHQRFTVRTTSIGDIVLRAVDLLSGESIGQSLMLTAGDGGSAMGGFLNASVIEQDGHTFYYAQVASPEAATTSIVSGFEITAPAEMSAGVEAQRISIRAVDREGNTVVKYTGTIAFSSTDKLAVLPALGRYTFKPSDRGMREFSLALKFITPGQQIFRVEDSANPDIVGQTTVQVQGNAPGYGSSPITITSHKNNQKINTRAITLAGRGSPFIDVIVRDVVANEAAILGRGGTDQAGSFAIPITISNLADEVTFLVSNENNQNESAFLHLIIDTVPPVIDSVTFSPEKPSVSEPGVLAVAKGEPGLASLTMRFPAEKSMAEITLIEAPAAPGTYQALFTAPSQAGPQQAVVTAKDEAGNETALQVQLTVNPQTLPIVQNLRAQGRAKDVLLTWDPVDLPVEGYMIYYGTNPDDLVSSRKLPTKKPLTQVAVNGLTPNTPYYFAVTAVRGELESAEMSNIVTATIVGLGLNVREQDRSLFLDWSSLPKEIPVQTFLLEFDADQDEPYAGKQMLLGESRNTTITDLINGVHYYVRLTPMREGKLITDLQAFGEGTPHGDGAFHGVAGDALLPAVSMHAGAPLNPAGLPVLALLGAGALAAPASFFAWRRRRARQEAAFLNMLRQRR